MSNIKHLCLCDTLLLWAMLAVVVMVLLLAPFLIFTLSGRDGGIEHQTSNVGIASSFITEPFAC